MNFSYVFIRRPIGTTLLAIGLLLVGATAYVFLPVASLPTVDFPTISVSASRILLIGIVKKNGIMMVDFALDGERRRGLSPREAIHEACLARFRPILMTTIAAALGALPLVIATGPSSELRRPLGITIIGGLLVSQALTLYTTPGDLSVTRVSAPAVRRQKLHLPPPPSRRIVAGFAGSLRDGRSALKKERP